MSKISNDELYGIAREYNRLGRKSICEKLKTEYGIKNTTSVLKRIKNRDGIEYIESEDRFEIHSDPSENGDDVFMSMDELCSPHTDKTARGKEFKTDTESRPEAMDRLVRELIGDRLLELSRYVTLDTISKKLLVDLTSLTNEGYRMETV
jgi:hypothetical protein